MSQSIVLLDHFQSDHERVSSAADATTMRTFATSSRRQEPNLELRKQTQVALNKAERVHYQDELQRQEEQLRTVTEETTALEALETLRDRISSKLASSTPEERRWVLQTLQTRVSVSPESVDVSVGVPPLLVNSVNNTRLLRCTTSCP